MAPQDSRRKFSKTKKSAAELCQILHIVTIYFVITPLTYSSVSAWLYPAGTALPSKWCFWFVTMFFCFSVCHAPTSESYCSLRGGYSSNKYCVTVSGSILMQFTAFFQKWLLFQLHYTVLIFVPRWRHIFHKIAVIIAKSPKIGGKFVCTT